MNGVTWDKVAQFAEKAIQAGKYSGGTRAGAKVLISDVGDLLQKDEPRDLEYLRENVKTILQRNTSRKWTGQSFNVYVSIFKRILSDYEQTQGNAYNVKSSRSRISRGSQSSSGQSRKSAPQTPEAILDTPSVLDVKVHRVSLSSLEGPVTVTLPQGITGKSWAHISKLLDDHVEYLISAEKK